jgi:dipeptidyl aminopeptidase/acylaminoacyl peptidase
MRSDLPNSYFVVHGAKDQAVSVENARSAVQKMQALGLDYKYLEIKDAAHGGYDKWDDILSWLGKKVDWKLVAPTLKSPQKRR